MIIIIQKAATVMSHVFNSLPHDMTLDWSKLKEFADDKINVMVKLKYVLERVENIWENEKMLVTKGFSYRLVEPCPKQALFLRVCSTSLLKTLWEKQKLLLTINFSFSHCVFYPFGEPSAIFIHVQKVVCKLFQFGRV